MLGSEAVTSMKERLSRFTSAGTDLDNFIERELKQAQQRLERMETLPWFLISEKSFISITINDERVKIPATFLRENEDDDMQVFETEESTWSEMKKSTMDAMRVRYPNEQGGLPRQYDYAGQYFRIRPIPDKTTYRLYMTFYKQADVFSLTKENSWLKYVPDLMISNAGIIVATGLRNKDAQAMFSDLRKSELKRLSDDAVAREMANYDPNPED